MTTRIQALKNFYGLSTRALALQCGMNQPTVDRMLKGINAISANFISSLMLAFPDVSAEWLIRGEGEMLKQDISSKELERINKLTNVAETLQDVIDSKNQTIADLTERIKQLESQLNK
ncbi:MAG: hypothetical protein HDR93_01415 [Bacteroides sp.]|nr:hypothetical protein [Bacteroides sp.]